MFKVSHFSIFLTALVLLACAGCGKTPSDAVLMNGKIYTVDSAAPWVEAVAIAKGKYIYIGDTAGAKDYIGARTQVTDLGGKMVMPSIYDAHLHPTQGAIEKLFQCSFGFEATPDQIAARVAQCVAQNPDAVWVRGGRWDSSFFDNHNIASPRRFLDAVSGDKAVFLGDDSGHNGWANTKALALMGITKETPEPVDGSYVRDPVTGEPNGVLLEGASQTVEDRLPEWSEAHFQKAALEAVRIANQFGITGLKVASSTEQVQASYHALDQRGELNAYVAISMKTPYGNREVLLDYDKLDRLKHQYKSPRVLTSFVKIYMDGVPTVARTAAMLAPYVPAEPGAPENRGLLHLEPQLLRRDLIELDRRGYTVKIHTAGDRAVKVALDAIASTRQANGHSGLRHELAHAGYIDETDIHRFAELQAVADLSPYLWHPSPIIASVIDAVGHLRGSRYWPIKDLLAADAPVLAGSDWPAAVASMNPWIGIEAMITRKDPRGETPGALWPEQAISLEQTLKIYTLDSARALLVGKQSGSIKLGKSADLIVLNHNLFDIEPEDISQTKVELTLFSGQTVYQRDR